MRYIGLEGQSPTIFWQGFDLMILDWDTNEQSFSSLDIIHNVAKDITDGRAEQG